MPKIPYKPKKTTDEDYDDEDDEIVSFEAFCSDTGGKSKNDTLTLNDNINYRLYYENSQSDYSADKEPINDPPSQEELKETSLTGPKVGNSRNKGASSFNSFGKFYPRAKSSFLKNVIPRAAQKDNSSNDGREHKYERFTDSRSRYRNIFSHLPGLGSSILVLSIVCVLCVAVWWAVYGAIGEAWSEEHYRRLWERAHPNHNQQTHYFPSVIVHQQLERLDPMPQFEPKYHDHNNLSTKNKANATENSKLRQKYTKKLLAAMKRDEELIPDAEQCSAIIDDNRFDCFPEAGANEEGCRKRGCCWVPQSQSKHIFRHLKLIQDPQANVGFPYCFYPANYTTYRFVTLTENKHGMSVYWVRNYTSYYPQSFDNVRMDIKYLSDDSLHVKIYDADNKRYEPPYPEIPIVPSPINNLQYRVIIEGSKTGFKIVRLRDNTTIFSTQDVGALILSDKFLQISSLLPTHNLFGLGERRGNFLLNTKWQRYTFFNHDTVPNEDTNLYGTHPFYLGMEDSGRSHGVLLLNSNAMEIILQPAPAITYRTVGGILNFFIFLGPKPSDVVSQYTGLIGRPFMPPYWSLGFHLCKYEYGSLNVTHQVWKSNREAGIPFDVQWNDLDYMNNSNDFTYDKDKYDKLPEFVDELHHIGMHYIPLVDAGVSASEMPGTYPPYDIGLEMNVFIKNSTDQPFIGKVWNKGSTAWPDFTHPNATSYWVQMFKLLHNDVKFDGAWIDMNEPSNFLSGPISGSCAPEDLPYMPAIGGNELKTKTLCMDAKHFAGSHFNLHSLFSLTEAIATNFALTEIRGTRPFIISRSSFVGLGHYSGHWSGDIASEWHDMKMTIPELLSFSLFGVPMMGADICGFNGNTTEELCLRWMQLGAWYPFSRNHNSDSSLPQDPVSMGKAVVDASRSALRARYTLLPYLYTLFWRAHTRGETVARPLFFEFVRDNVTFPIDQQFMLGPAIMIAPILNPGVKTVRAYLPKTKWYSFQTSSPIPTTDWCTLQEDQTVLVRGGSILPMQTPNDEGPVTTSSARSLQMQLLVAFDVWMKAQGELYWDDGDSINTFEEKKYSHVKFKALNNTVRGDVVWRGYKLPSADRVIILGITHPVSTVTLNNQLIPHTYNPETEQLILHDFQLILEEPFTIEWILE